MPSPPSSADQTVPRNARRFRIALIHATALAIDPVKQAFARHWPEAQLMNLLDDSLSEDHARNAGQLTEVMNQRFVNLALYARGTGADAILFTCSAFGPAIEKAALASGIPTLKPNQAMFEEAMRLAPTRTAKLALLATFEPSLAPMVREFEDLALNQGSPLRLEPHHVPDAMACLAQGEARRHDQMIAGCAAQLAQPDLILLAQFSMAAAQAATQQACTSPVLTSPDCAVLALKQQLTQAGSSTPSPPRKA